MPLAVNHGTHIGIMVSFYPVPFRRIICVKDVHVSLSVQA